MTASVHCICEIDGATYVEGEVAATSPPPPLIGLAILPNDSVDGGAGRLSSASLRRSISQVDETRNEGAHLELDRDAREQLAVVLRT